MDRWTDGVMDGLKHVGLVCIAGECQAEGSKELLLEATKRYHLNVLSGCLLRRHGSNIYLMLKEDFVL